MRNEKPKTYYNRCQTARILGTSPRQLRNWERAHDGALFKPCRPPSCYSREALYHRVQIESMDRALADPDNAARYEEEWQLMRGTLGVLTLSAAEDLGLVGATL